jgi:hypothetical protein
VAIYNDISAGCCRIDILGDGCFINQQPLRINIVVFYPAILVRVWLLANFFINLGEGPFRRSVFCWDDQRGCNIVCCYAYVAKAGLHAVSGRSPRGTFQGICFR